MGILGKPLTWVSLSALAAIVFLVLLVAKLSPQLSATAGPTPAPSGLRADIVILDSHGKQLCPLAGDQVGQAQRALGPTVKLSLLVVSVAPATDTPDSERGFAAARHRNR